MMLRSSLKRRKTGRRERGGTGLSSHSFSILFIYYLFRAQNQFQGIACEGECPCLTAVSASVEVELRHIFNALDTDKDGSLSQSDYDNFNQNMANTQTWKNKTAYTALTEHLAANGEVDSMSFEEFKYIYALANQMPNKNNSEKATAEWKALLVIVSGGMLLIYGF